MPEEQNEKEISDNTDFVLKTFVSFANKQGLNTWITLTVGGLLISGELIGGRTYFEELAIQLRGAKSNIKEFVSGIADGFEEAGRDIYPEPSHTEMEEEDADNSLISYIHLRHVKLLHPASMTAIPATDGVLWRGRLSAVDGFILGKMSAES